MTRTGSPERRSSKVAGEVVGDVHDADQAALTGHRVVTPRPAGRVFGTRGATVRRPLTGVGDEGGEPVARVLGGGHHADLLQGVGPPALSLRLQGADDGEPVAIRELAGDVDKESLVRLAVHVERFLAEIGGAAPEVFGRARDGKSSRNAVVSR